MSSIAFNLTVGGSLHDATSVVLCDATSAFGVRRTDTLAIVVAASTAMNHDGTGVYSYTFADPANDLTYEYWIKWVYAGSTYYEQQYTTGPVTPPAPPTATDYLITLAEYKSFADIPPNVTANDIQINALRAAVDAQFNTFLGWHVIQGTYSEVISGTGASFIRLKHRPIASISSIVTGYNGSAPVTWTGTDFIYDPNGSIVRWSPAVPVLPDYFDRGRMPIQVNYTAGYAVADVPQDLKRAAFMMISRIINLVSDDARSDFKLHDYSQTSNIVQLSNAMFEDIRMILRQWQTVRFI